MTYDMETQEALLELSLVDNSPNAVSRRTFLQLVGAGAAVAALPSFLAEQAAAVQPIGTNEGILIVMYLAGGNDGLNTVVPFGDNGYVTKRGSLALSAGNVLDIGGGLGFNNRLTTVKSLWDKGAVAVMQGVGYPGSSLSHFDAIASVMAGHISGGNPGSGWVGRYLDGLSADVFKGITVGTSTPLLVRGNSRQGSAVPGSLDYVFGTDHISSSDDRMYNAVRTLAGAGSTDSWAGRYASIGRDSMDLVGTLSPLLAGLGGDGLSNNMALCARLINANLGTRVFNVTLEGFDTHANQSGSHETLLSTVDGAIKTFFDTLAPQWRAQTTILVYSEFGRRVERNVSAGTDHGTANEWLLIGEGVRGGLHGERPSLANLDSNGNQRFTTDFRTVLATLLDGWLGADSAQVIGGNFGSMQLFDSPLSSVGGPPTGPGYWITDSVGKVSAFGGLKNYGSAPAGARISGMAVTADRAGYWLVGDDGAVFSYGTAAYHGGMNGSPLATPIVDLIAAPSGGGYWLLGTDGGVFSFGDARFFGSTGDIKLAAPVVGMATTPSGGGYWFVAQDGGIFAFGDAKFYGSIAGLPLAAPVVGMASTTTGRGYWLVARDGGVFSFGDAGFHGSTGGVPLVAPIVGIAATETGAGYWFVARDGGLFAFGDAGFHGSLAGSGRSVVDMGG